MFPSRRVIFSGGEKFKNEYSVAFDGTDDNIRIPEIEYNVDGSTVSFVFWLKRAAIGATQVIIGHTSSNGNSFMRFNSSNEIKFESDTNGDVATVTQNTIDTEWHHYVITASSGTVTAYQDGVVCSVSGNVGDDNFTINTIGGSGTNGVDNEFNGTISEIAAYDIAFTSSQAKEIYNDREPFDHKNWSKTGNLTQWWRFGDGKFDGNRILTDEANPTRQAELLANPTIDSNTTGWNGYAGGGDENTLARETSITHNGDGSLKITFVADNGGWVGSAVSAVTGVANKLIVFEGWCYIPTNSYAFDDIFFTDGSGFGGASAETTAKRAVPGTANVWQFIRTMSIPVSGDTSGAFYIYTSGTDPSAGDIIYFDDLSARVYNGATGQMYNMSQSDFVGDTP